MARGKSNNSKKNIKKNTKAAKKQDLVDKSGDFKGLALIAIGIILAIAIYTNLAGGFSVFAQKVIYNLVGVGAYIIPAFLIYFGIDSIMSKGTIEFSRRLFGISLLAIVVTLAFSTAHISEIISNESMMDTLKKIVPKGGLHGGFLGALITYPLYRALGFLGSYVIYITLGAMGGILIFDITLKDIIDYIGYEFSKINGKIKEHKLQKKEAYKEIDEDTNKRKEKKYKSSFIDIDDEDIEKQEFLDEVNHKIKILDFMKNSSLEDYDIQIKEKQEDEFENKIEIFNSTNEYEDYDEFEDNLYKEVQSSFDIPNNPEKITLNKKESEEANKEVAEAISEANEDQNISGYNYPSIELLEINKIKSNRGDNIELMDSAQKLTEILHNFGVDANVSKYTKGPSVTRFEIQPAPGVKVSKIVNLQDDLALGLAASGIRMEAPIPGKAAIGIEVPNKKQSPVFLREVLSSKEFKESNKNLAFSLGKDIEGRCVIGDLAKMPHTLIAGATGSGKSVCINTLIVSLLYKYSPEDVRLLMVDPKVVELSVYNGIPHLLIPVVTEPKKAAGALNWAVNEMERRYNTFSASGVRNIESYNSLLDKGIIQEKLPYIVIIVDELADLMMTCPGEVEDYICRLAQKARAAGMHLVIATQRPSVNVITGTIKANIPSRISFAVSSSIDSRTILDASGAEKLLGRGDMLYYPTGESKPLRVQGAFISEEEVERVVTFIKEGQNEAEYKEDIIEHINKEAQVQNSEVAVDDSNGDELIEEAIKVVVEYQQASTSFIQRKFRVGFNRASRIMDELEERGIISEKDGSRPRQVLVTKAEIYGED